jgi:hypothetical protein
MEKPYFLTKTLPKPYLYGSSKILYNIIKGKVVRYKHDTTICQSYIFHDLFKGGICQKKPYFLTIVKNALKYGFSKRLHGKLGKPYHDRPFADIGKYWFGNFIQKLTFNKNLTFGVIFRGDNYYYE